MNFLLAQGVRVRTVVIANLSSGPIFTMGWNRNSVTG